MKNYLTAVLCAILTACGGGGGSNTAANGSNSVILKGVASKGPLNGSNICAYAIVANIKSSLLAPCANNISNGIYTIDAGSYSGAILLEASGGSYIDEATGLTVPLVSTLHALLPSVSGGISNAAITPLTELAFQDTDSQVVGLSSERMQLAYAKVQANFGVVDILKTLPVDALNVPAGASIEQKKYALALAAISQYQHAQPVGTTLSGVLLKLQDCLSNPSTACGSASSGVAKDLSAAMGAFQAAHPTFAGLGIASGSFGATSASPPATASKSTYQTAFDACYIDTPLLYTAVYCTAYASEIAAGGAPPAANQKGASAAGTNVGNIGMGTTVSAVGIPNTASTSGTATDPNYLARPKIKAIIHCPAIGTQPASDIMGGAVDGPCYDLELAAVKNRVCGSASSSKVVAQTEIYSYVCAANNSMDPYRTNLVNEANYLALAYSLPKPSYNFSTTPTPAVPPVFELGVGTLNAYTLTAKLVTSCLQLPSADFYKVGFGQVYLYHSMYNSLSACEAAAATWVASGGTTVGISVAQFKSNTAGTPGTISSGAAELAASTACMAQPYLGSDNNPQVDSYAKIAQFDACLHRAGFTQYDVEGRANCQILDSLLKSTNSQWTTTYCPYPF